MPHGLQVLYRDQPLPATPEAIEPAPEIRRVALLGTFPPRKCGIATFTQDVRDSLRSASPGLECDVVALVRDDEPSGDARWRIRQNDPKSFVRCAERLNEINVDLVCIQHEFGIFGGEAGDYLLEFVSRIRAPLVITLHTVLERPNADQRRVMRELAQRAHKLIVMARKGADLLRSVYRVEPDKIAVIPHGAPDRAWRDPDAYKAQFGWANRRVALTFGLLSPSKGIETIIEAMPYVVERCPGALYVVLGATHPDLLRREGEAYRDELKALAERLGVADAVQFINHYCELDELLDRLGAADVYATPYLNEAQITSGTLAYAVAMGKPVVSTPYWHATEAIAADSGRLAPFGDSAAFAAALGELLSDDQLRQSFAQNAYQRGRRTIWPEFASRYLDIFEDVYGQEDSIQPLTQPHPSRTPDLSAVRRLCDDCGVIQFGKYGIPDRSSGYCTDDVARAYVLLLRYLARGGEERWVEAQADRFAAFLEHAWNPETGRFRNFMSYGREWLDDGGSEDSNGRAFYAVAAGFALGPRLEHRAWARSLLKRCAPHLREMTSPRAQAFAVQAAALWRQMEPDLNAPNAIVRAFGGNLHRLLKHIAKPDWTWFEERLAYDNARLPQGLLLAGAALGDSAMRADALHALEWLCHMQKSEKGLFRPAGNQFAGPPFAAPAQFDQQPLEATATIEACMTAWRQTRRTYWRQEAQRAYEWFFGANDLGVSIAAEDGGCYDGLHAKGVNRNQGAESTISLQLANLEMNLI
ncbi:MAG: glycosyltransferase family 4 protein [Pseudomonadota bacterium]